jgi:hypothetical protein
LNDPKRCWNDWNDRFPEEERFRLQEWMAILPVKITLEGPMTGRDRPQAVAPSNQRTAANIFGRGLNASVLSCKL